MFEGIADILVYQWLGFSKDTHLGAAIHFFAADTPQILVLLSVSIFIISVIRSYFPPEKTRDFLSRRHSFIGNVLAALIGIITPFCSCSAVPLFIGFIEAGVPLGVTFSFLISSPLVNEVALILLLGLFGWKIALLYMVSGVLIAIFAGVLIGALHLEHLLEDYSTYSDESSAITSVQSFGERCRVAAQSTAALLKYITPFIVLAIAIGGLIHGFVPEEFITRYAGKEHWFAVPLVVAMGVPLYNSAGGMVPIVYSLIEKGLPLGTALAFMMAVSAISFPEMIILRKVLKVKLIAIFAGILTLAITFTGYLFNLIS